MSIFSSPWLQRTRSRGALLRVCQTQVEDEAGFCDFLFCSLAQFPPPPLQFTGRVFSNGGSAAFLLLPYIIYARRREVALPFARVSTAEAMMLWAHTEAPNAFSGYNNLIATYICAHSDICNVDADQLIFKINPISFSFDFKLIRSLPEPKPGQLGKQCFNALMVHPLLK